MRVNLQPDDAGPSHRNQSLLTDPAHGYDRVPPTQRLASSGQTRNSAEVGHSRAKCCSTVLDRRAAAALRQPREDGSSEAYKCETTDMLMFAAYTPGSTVKLVCTMSVWPPSGMPIAKPCALRLRSS